MLTICLKIFLCCGCREAWKEQQKINALHYTKWQEEHPKKASTVKKVTFKETVEVINFDDNPTPMNREIVTFLNEQYNSDPNT